MGRGAARGLCHAIRRPRLTPELKRLAIIAAPAVLAGGVVQINLLVGRQVASFTENAISWLNFADRLYQLPLGVVGIAVGVVLLPELSRRLAAGDDAGGQHSFNRGMEFSLFLTVPSAVALAVIGAPIVAVLFGRGAWTDADTQATALALAVYALGLPAFVLQKVLQPLYYARHDTKRPFQFALTSMVVNAAVAIGLMPLIGFVAAAWATSFAAWVMVWQLVARGARYGAGRADRCADAAGGADRRPRLRRWGRRFISARRLLAPYLALARLALSGASGADRLGQCRLSGAGAGDRRV